MQYEFKTRRYFGNPVNYKLLEAWKGECRIKFGTGVAAPVEKLPGAYTFYIYRQPEAYTTAYGDWAAAR